MEWWLHYIVPQPTKPVLNKFFLYKLILRTTVTKFIILDEFLLYSIVTFIIMDIGLKEKAEYMSLGMGTFMVENYQAVDKIEDITMKLSSFA